MLKKISTNRKKLLITAGIACLAGVVLSFLLMTFAATVQETDFNNDGKVDFVDLSTLLTNYGKSGLAGDVNKDGVVDIFDLSATLSNYGKSVGTASCASTTPHIPDGPDGMGGCWPGPSNTGPNAPESSMPQFNSCSINSPDVVIDSKVINCSPLVVGSGANGLLIMNSYIKGGVVQKSSSASFTIQDSHIDNSVNYPACAGNACPAGKYACGDPNNATTDCGVGYKNFKIYRTEIINTNRAAYCEYNCIIENNYFHGTNLWPDITNLAHASSVRNEQSLNLHHNSLNCDYRGPFPNKEIGCSADMSGYPDFAPIKDATIDFNLFMQTNNSADYCAYGGFSNGHNLSGDPTNATNIKFTNNIFQRGPNGKCGNYGPITDFDITRAKNVWTNNRYDNGALINP